MPGRLQPFYEGRRRTEVGCASSELTTQGYQVHVIRLTNQTVNFVTITAIGKSYAHCDFLVFLRTYRTTGLPVKNTPLTNIPKGFSSKMTLEVA